MLTTQTYQDKKYPQESLQGLLAAIVESSEDAIVSATTEGIITSWNPGAERLFGFGAAEAIGNDIGIIIPPPLADEQKRIFEQAKEGQTIKHYETVRTRKDGQYIDIDVSVSPIRDAEERIIGTTLMAQDNTARKIVAVNLQAYLRELEGSNQELHEFSHLACHDLKEPLRGLSYMASILLDSYKDKIDEDGVKLLDKLVVLCRRMDSLISNMLYFSELENKASALQETDSSQIIKEVQQMMEFSLKERNAHIVIPHPLPTIVCDKVRITEAFRNLISNAIKHNDKKEPAVEVGFLESVETKRGREKNVFYIKDNGPGIEPKYHQMIFTMFKKAPSSAQVKKPGSGVGLAFTKKIIERHNGRIWLESELGKGSTFYFTIGKKQDKTDSPTSVVSGTA